MPKLFYTKNGIKYYVQSIIEEKCKNYLICSTPFKEETPDFSLEEAKGLKILIDDENTECYIE